MATQAYTKSGAKAQTPVKLPKTVFDVEVKNQALLKDAYLAYLANGRKNLAITKKRGQVSGGGRKPHPQKGTGRARVGSSRNPIWRGGGVAFGPTGAENYSRKLSLNARHRALAQALSLASREERIRVIESVDFDGKVKTAQGLLLKIGAIGNTLIVVEQRKPTIEMSIRNLQGVTLETAKNISAHPVLDADVIVIEKSAVDSLEKRLGGSNE